MEYCFDRVLCTIWYFVLTELRFNSQLLWRTFKDKEYLCLLWGKSIQSGISIVIAGMETAEFQQMTPVKKRLARHFSLFFCPTPILIYFSHYLFIDKYSLETRDVVVIFSSFSLFDCKLFRLLVFKLKNIHWRQETWS